jgi:GTP-binding protein
MFKEIEFLKSVFNKTGMPKSILPEIALCGRSNVGKSTFINSLFNRKYIAKTSSTPGKTRSINFYLVEKLFYLVDLPGFGFAKVSKEERSRWDKLIDDYFLSGRNIKLVIHFIDSRHKPTSTDIQLNKYLKELAIPTIVILNKIDKLKQSGLALLKKEICSFFPELILGENLLYYSAVKGTGRSAVQIKIRSFV